VKKALLFGVAALFLATGTAHANENYFVQCGDARLIEVFGHHGFQFYLRIGERQIELPSRLFRFGRATENGGRLYFRGRKCVCAPVQLPPNNC
jgi:hypothetical protein